LTSSKVFWYYVSGPKTITEKRPYYVKDRYVAAHSSSDRGWHVVIISQKARVCPPGLQQKKYWNPLIIWIWN